MSAADTLRCGPVAAAIRRHRLVVVLRHLGQPGAQLDLALALADAGARVFQVDFDAPAAEADLAALRGCLAGRRDGPFLVGAGAIMRRGQLDAARRAGAEFAVSPLLDPSLVDVAVSAHVPFIAGACTPAEVQAAWSAGTTFIQLFPAWALGPPFVRALRGPLPGAELIPAGGVDASNARLYLDAGAAAVSIGSALARADAAGRRALLESITGRATGLEVSA